jgi:hypothetical protein
MNPTRPLSPQEKMTIHDELDYAGRFTERYRDIFDQRLFRGNEQLMELSYGICSALLRMKHRGENSLAHYSTEQLQLETTKDVAVYLKLLCAFSKERMKAMNEDVDNGKFVEGGSPPCDYTHWQEDQHTLQIMSISINMLFHEISQH